MEESFEVVTVHRLRVSNLRFDPFLEAKRDYLLEKWRVLLPNE